MNEPRPADQRHGLGFWLWEELISIALMLAALVAVFLVPESLRTIVVGILLVSLVALSIGNVVTSVDTIRSDPVKRRRAERIWHTVGARIFLGGFIAVVVGFGIAGASIAVSVWTHSLATLNLLETPAMIVIGLGVAALFVGLVTYLIEDSIIRDSRWHDGLLR